LRKRGTPGGQNFGEREKGRRTERGRQEEGENFLESRGKQAAETKKKGKPEGAKLLRNELEGRNKFEKGDRGGLQRSRNRGGVFGSKVRKQNHPFRVPSSCSSLSTVAFGHHHPAPPFRHHRRCHQQQQRRNRNKTEKEKEQEREQKQRGSKGEKGEEPPAAALIATTSATPEPLPAAAVLPVIGNSPCTVRNRRRNPEKTETEEEEAAKQRRRRTTVAPP
jgi:hypothetical protein